MPSIVFQNLLKQSSVKIQSDEKNSVDWFRKMALGVKQVNTKDLITDTKDPFKRIVKLSETSVGKMYMFTYDPKTKADLPYYDRYPLIFPVDYHADGFSGINLHYLPPLARAKLMDALYTIINNNKQDKTTKLKISYQVLKSSSKFVLFKACYKKYLFNHVRSNFLYIAPDEWNIALMLPTQKFLKTTPGGSDIGVDTTQIYRDSIRKTYV